MDMRGQALKTKRETQAKCDLPCIDADIRASPISMFLSIIPHSLFVLARVLGLESHLSLQVWLELRRLRHQRAWIRLIEPVSGTGCEECGHIAKCLS